MSESALHSKKPWRAVLARRRWRSGYNAGGSPNFIGKLSSVIQLYLVKVLTLASIITVLATLCYYKNTFFYNALLFFYQL
jgi:hypothetical protein